MNFFSTSQELWLNYKCGFYKNLAVLCTSYTSHYTADLRLNVIMIYTKPDVAAFKAATNYDGL